MKFVRGKLFEQGLRRTEATPEEHFVNHDATGRGRIEGIQRCRRPDKESRGGDSALSQLEVGHGRN